jgi:Cdc6-like AAA superfamily ATPase
MLDYVRQTSQKMLRYREKTNIQGGLAKLWIITEQEPTADQRSFCKGKGINVQSFTEFRKNLFNAQSYLAARPTLPFGSATDPKTDNTDITGVKYQTTAIREKNTDRTFTLDYIKKELCDGRIVVLLGDYGMGKSIAVRELFKNLASAYMCDQSAPVPVSINLRDCWGLRQPDEVLQRHATKLALKDGRNLVKAFNCGLLITLLDGFDETASNVTWNGGGSVDRDQGGLRTKLKSIRREAVSVVREFVATCRGKSGLLITDERTFSTQLQISKTRLGFVIVILL